MTVQVGVVHFPAAGTGMHLPRLLLVLANCCAPAVTATAADSVRACGIISSSAAFVEGIVVVVDGEGATAPVPVAVAGQAFEGVIADTAAESSLLAQWGFWLLLLWRREGRVGGRCDVEALRR